VLSIDEKTQIQALDRTQPLLPITFDAIEKRTHDYVRHGTTNLFAALNVGTGEVFGQCTPNRNGDTFLAFLKKAVKPHAGTDGHVVDPAGVIWPHLRVSGGPTALITKSVPGSSGPTMIVGG
jgi:hypothetical protein